MIFKAQPTKLFPYILVMIVVAIGTFAGSVFIFIQLAYIDQFLLFDNSTYWNLAKMVSVIYKLFFLKEIKRFI